jgi:uridine kinase
MSAARSGGTSEGEGARARLLWEVAALVPAAIGDDCVRVGVDGVDGSGKTVFAGELAAVLRAAGRPVVRIGGDDFHHVKAIRYRRGRSSPDGFWLDSFDYQRLWADVLGPCGPGGSRRHRTVAHDLTSDRVLDPPYQRAGPGTVVVVDGLFLHRAELAGAWELSIFLDVPFAESAQRMARRDGTNPDPDHPSQRRYVDAQRLYFAAATPHTRADVLIDNATIDRPCILRATAR